MRRVFALALVSTLASLTLMCSSDPDGGGAPSDAGGLADGRFRGLFAGSGDLSGVVDLTIQNTSTRPRADGDGASYTVEGSVVLNVPGEGPIRLTGTLDLATSAVSLSGTAASGPVTFSGQYAEGVIRGTLTTTLGSGPLDLTNEELGGMRIHCGTFDGALRGRWSMLVTGTRVRAVYAASTGEVGRGEGTLEGGASALTLSPTGTASGRETNGAFTGSWAIGERTGNFAASEGACAGLVPAATDGGTTDGGTTDGATEAGPPGVPEIVHEVGGTVPVGHLTIAGTTLVYALDYLPFQQKREIATVGVDGSAPATIVPVNTTGTYAVAGLSVLGGRVFWTTGGTFSGESKLFSVPLAGGAIGDHGTVATSSQLEDYVAGVTRMVNDGTTLFITTDGSGTDSLRAYDATGNPGATFAEDVVGPSGLALDGSDVVFAEFSGLRKTPKTLAAASTLLTARAEYGEFDTILNSASDANAYYFMTRELNSAKVWRRARSGGAPAPVIAPVANPRARGFVLVDDYLYFVLAPPNGQPPPGQLVRVAKTATNATATPVGPANVQDLVTDGTYVYYGEGTRVRRVHK